MQGGGQTRGLSRGLCVRRRNVGRGRGGGRSGGRAGCARGVDRRDRVVVGGTGRSGPVGHRRGAGCHGGQRHAVAAYRVAQQVGRVLRRRPGEAHGVVGQRGGCQTGRGSATRPGRTDVARGHVAVDVVGERAAYAGIGGRDDLVEAVELVGRRGSGVGHADAVRIGVVAVRLGPKLGAVVVGHSVGEDPAQVVVHIGLSSIPRRSGDAGEVLARRGDVAVAVVALGHDGQRADCLGDGAVGAVIAVRGNLTARPATRIEQTVESPAGGQSPGVDRAGTGQQLTELVVGEVARARGVSSSVNGAVGVVDLSGRGGCAAHAGPVAQQVVAVVDRAAGFADRGAVE